MKRQRLEGGGEVRRDEVSGGWQTCLIGGRLPGRGGWGKGIW